MTYHAHCDNCIKILKCTVRAENGVSCPIVCCDNVHCVSQMHHCKLQDHRVICKYEKVSCINSTFGCDHLLLRKDMSAHLLRCPANVIHCSVEWNRWPIYTGDRKLTFTSAQILPQSFDVNHLDVSLALRDQRMLKEFWSAERRTQRMMRNYLTQKYPAVPLKGLHVSDSINKSASQSSCGTNSSQTALTSPSEDTDSESSPWQMTKSPPGLQSSVCAKLMMTKDDHSNVYINDENKLDFSSAVQPLPVVVNTSPLLIPSPPALPQCNSLSLDINVRTIPMHQPKPRLMYTFRCACELRRDEYEWHYKNCHNDIHGSIDGWMEHRCPLWQYGCNFVHRRWHPNPNGAKIVFNGLVENFGLLMPPQDENMIDDDDCDIHFEYLPFEILQNICQHLDSFSLNNLSITCKRLREVCRSFLDNRGIVSIVWERKLNENGKHSWDIGHKKWFFSCAFTPVTSWHIDGNHAVTQHLSQCPYFIREPKLEPFKLPQRESEPKKQL